MCVPALLLQEQTKAWLAVAQDLAVMVCVLLSDPTLPHAPAPLPALVATAFLGVLDMVRKKEGGGRKDGEGCACATRRMMLPCCAPHRFPLAPPYPGPQIRLESLLRLHAVKWLCFFIVEADFWLRAPGHG